MPSIPGRVPTPRTSHDDRDLATLVKAVCRTRGYKADYLPDWMDKRDCIGALHGLLGLEDKSRSRVSKADLVALYTVCTGSEPVDGTTVGELRVGVADAIHFHHDYTEGGDGLRKDTLEYAVLTVAANHVSDEQESVTADTVTMPTQASSVADNEYSQLPMGTEGKQYTKQAVLDFLTDLSEANGGDPVTTTTITQAEGPSVATVVSRFGGIPEARKAAGLEAEPTAGAPKKYTEDDILLYIRRLESYFGHPPTQRDVRESSGVSLSTIRSRFGSLEDARDTAGVGHPEVDTARLDGPGPGKDTYDRATLIEHLQHLADELGHPPSYREINDMDGPSLSPYSREFGGIVDARDAADVGHPNSSDPEDDPEEATETEADNETGLTADYDCEGLLEYLTELADELEKPPSATDINEADGPSAAVFTDRFGGVVDAREEAGVGHPGMRQRLMASGDGT